MQKSTLLKNLHEHTFGTRLPISFITLLGFGLAITATSPNVVLAAGTVGDGTAASCTEAALAAALAGGGTVTFKCGSTPVTIPITSEKVISANTVIDGGNLISISGGGTTRVFKTADNGIQFTVQNLTIANGFTAAQGGGIYSGYRSKLTVINSKFNNNVSTDPGKFAGGGAIFIASESTASVDSSTFTGNKAGNGGAINSLLSDLTVSNTTFTGNKSIITLSGGGGGAIYHDGANGDNGKIVLRNNRFINNTAVFQGGAYFSQLYNNNTATIENSTFSGNTVTGTGTQGFGAAMFSIGGTLSGLIGFTGLANNAIVNITNSTFSGNSASNQGGAIWSGKEVTLNISNTTISGNRAMSADGLTGLGGGIMRTSGKINLTNSTIANNYAGFQGGGIVGDINVTLINTVIANNKANNGGKGWNIKNNCFDQMTNGGNNLQFPARNMNDPSDKDCVAGIQTADPKLGPLGNNGGSTQTMPLLTGSAAINTGNSSTCAPIDQRGVARPSGGVCDIGAFEAQ
ncbi:hypothetical protein H6F77_12570 [Microcoleus sp. FACHB-831]|uniref:choice-of-anchor Q domain-containing protein n=1 Tax=Microcoleus sp. FACHB-831 TaxID=2692827 RepID=UPI0016898C5C|nr:choice-of-anchor Q domain-containing protein [Microcoleus sp. FACHB-831]MBD1921920.1 hypothetical protein [Microcoleus sp. FACHB-831]